MSIETNTSNKRIAINLISNIVSFSSTLLISLVLTPFLINTLGKETYSFFPLANNFVSYATIVTIALNSMASRFITIAIHRKEEKKANEYFSSVFISNIIMSIVILILLILMILNLNKILNIPEYLSTDVKITFTLVFINFIISLLSTVFNVATFVKNRRESRRIHKPSSPSPRPMGVFFDYRQSQMFQPRIAPE